MDCFRYLYFTFLIIKAKTDPSDKWLQASANSMLFQDMNLNILFQDKREAETIYVLHCPHIHACAAWRWADFGAKAYSYLIAVKGLGPHFFPHCSPCLQDSHSLLLWSIHLTPKHPSSLSPITTPLSDAYFILQRLLAVVLRLLSLGPCDVFYLNSLLSFRIHPYPPRLSLPLIVMLFQVRGITCINSHRFLNMFLTGDSTYWKGLEIIV